MDKNKTILITGATSGIGAKTAELLIKEGHRVAVTGRNEEKLNSFVNSIRQKENILGIKANASDWKETQMAVEKTLNHFGSLDGAIANAGFASRDYHETKTNVFDDGDPSLWSAMVLTNVLGPALLAKATIPHLSKTNGRLILIGSVAGIKNAPANLYSATKWAVTGLAENLRMYATTIGVGVTLISPGFVETDFFQGQNKAPYYALNPKDVANLIIYALNQPNGVDINTLTVRPIGQKP